MTAKPSARHGENHDANDVKCVTGAHSFLPRISIQTTSEIKKNKIAHDVGGLIDILAHDQRRTARTLIWW
jgi:hypothetical protein